MDNFLREVLKQQLLINKELKEELHNQRIEMKEMERRMVELIGSIRDELNTYKIIIRFIKSLSWTIAFVLAFKFGEISELWKD